MNLKERLSAGRVGAIAGAAAGVAVSANSCIEAGQRLFSASLTTEQMVAIGLPVAAQALLLTMIAAGAFSMAGGEIGRAVGRARQRSTRPITA